MPATVIILIVIAALIAAVIFCAAPGRLSDEQKARFKGLYFAHRGLHSRDKSVPENSLAAFGRAADAGFGMELDLQLSKDGQVIVMHDFSLKRICGVNSQAGSLTLSELKSLRLLGTDETVPLFSEVLELVAGRTPLLIELKYSKRREELCAKTLELLKDYKGLFCIESFDPRTVGWFKKHAPGIVRGQLAEPCSTSSGIPPVTTFLLSRVLFNFIARPHFIAYRIGSQPLTVRLSEKMGALKAGWTLHNKEQEKGLDMCIFEFYLLGNCRDGRMVQ